MFQWWWRMLFPTNIFLGLLPWPSTRFLCRTVQWPGMLVGTVRYLYASVANLICSYRVSCACEPSILSIPNGISRTVRDKIVVRITRPSSFSFWFGYSVSLRAIRVCVSSFRVIFFIISTTIRNNPSTFFQNTNTILVRKFYSIFSVISVKLIGNYLFRINRGTTVLCTVQ